MQVVMTELANGLQIFQWLAAQMFIGFVVYVDRLIYLANFADAICALKNQTSSLFPFGRPQIIFIHEPEFLIDFVGSK